MSGSVILAGGAGTLGLAIALVVIAVAPGRPRQRGVAQALAAIEQRYGPAASAGGPGADPLGALPGWVRGIALWLSPAGVGGALQHRLDVAGNPRGWTPDRILAAKGAGLLGLAVLGLLTGVRNPGLIILGAALGGAFGFFLPDLLLLNAGQKRQARIQAGLPDALDMLTVCVEAGLGFDAALAQVARNTEGPLAAEFARALQEMQIGKSRAQALRAVAERTTVTELRAFVSSLVQAGELGIPVARVLREQSREMRVRRRQRAEYKAQQIGVKITFPLILCIFPALIVIVVGPGIIELAGTLLHHL